MATHAPAGRPAPVGVVTGRDEKAGGNRFGRPERENIAQISPKYRQISSTYCPENGSVGIKKSFLNGF